MPSHDDLMKDLAADAQKEKKVEETPPSHDALMKELAGESLKEKKVEEKPVRHSDLMKELAGEAHGEASSDDGIPEESRYHDIGPVPDSLDFTGNVGKSALYGLLQDPNSFVGDTAKATQYAQEAAAKQRRTSSAQIMDKLAENSKKGYGLPIWDRLSDGKETHLLQNLAFAGLHSSDLADDAVELGKKTVDKGRELAIDVAADPLTYAMGLHPSGPMAKEAVRGAMGGALGYGASGKDDSIPEVLTKTGAGVLAGVTGPALAAEGAKLAAPLVEGAADMLPRYMKGDRFRNFSQKYGTAKEAVAEREKIANQIMENYGRHTSEFPDEVLNEAKNAAADVKTKSNDFVKERMGNYVEDTEGFDEAPTGEKNKFPPGFRQKSRDVFFDREYPEARAEAMATLTPEGQKAYEAIEAHNSDMQDWVNRNYGSTDGKWFLTAENGAKGIGNMPYHVEDLHAFKDIDEALKDLPKAGLSGPLRASTASERARTWDVLGPQKSYEIYAHRIAKNFLSEAQRDALKFMQEYSTAPYAGKPQAVLGFIGNLASEANSIFKKSTLFTGVNFIRNHLLEDLKKSYMTNGLPGLVDAAMVGPNYLKYRGDIEQIMKGDYYHAFKNKHVGDAFIYGAADPHKTFWANEGGITKDYAQLRYGDRGVDLLSDKATTATKVKQATRRVVETLLNPTTVLSDIPGTGGKLGIRAVGQALETTMRVSHFARTKDMLLRSGEAMSAFGGQGIKRGMLGNEQALAKAGVNIDQLNRYAAKLTNDTFFNYRDASALNDMVLSKVIPFFNFHMKNAKLYIESSFNPTRMARVHHAMYLTRPPRQQPFTADEAAGLPPYTRDSNPQLDKRYENGGIDVHYEPKDTYNEAMKFALEPEHTLLENLNPALKLAVEHRYLGKDSFSGLPLNPSETSSGSLPIFGSGYLGAAEKKALEDHLPKGSVNPAEMALGLYGNQFSKNGYPQATDDTSHTIDRIESNMVPKTGLDQLFKLLGDTHIPGLDEKVFGPREGHGRYDLGQAVENLIGPYQVQHLEPWQLEQNREGSRWDKAKAKHLKKNLKEQLEKRKADFNGK